MSDNVTHIALHFYMPEWDGKTGQEIQNISKTMFHPWTLEGDESYAEFKERDCPYELISCDMKNGVRVWAIEKIIEHETDCDGGGYIDVYENTFSLTEQAEQFLDELAIPKINAGAVSLRIYRYYNGTDAPIKIINHYGHVIASMYDE